MNIYFEQTHKTEQIQFNGSATALLKKFEINPVTVLVVRNGTIVPESTTLQNADDIKILSVISGG